ncbi:MAG: DsbA family oxidoreductase [Nitrospira sp.]|nr:DsbA family oxidoreductase [Nitrospira sp.]
MTPALVAIEVYSDVVCPWCYVGKRRLERAINQLHGRVPTRVVWRPFQLNPTIPPEGIERTTYLHTKFGSREAYRQLEKRVMTAEHRLEFAFDKITVTPNTLIAHRLIWYAERFGVQDAVVEELFRGYFTEGRHIGRVEALIDAAERAGLDRNDAATFLTGDEGLEEVRREEAEGHRMGIRAVPCFILNEVSMLSGAQPTDVLVNAIEMAAKKGAEEGWSGQRGGIRGASGVRPVLIR